MKLVIQGLCEMTPCSWIASFLTFSENAVSLYSELKNYLKISNLDLQYKF